MGRGELGLHRDREVVAVRFLVLLLLAGCASTGGDCPKIHASCRCECGPVPGLLEDTTVEIDDLQDRVDDLLQRGILEPHPTDPKRGPRYSKLVYPPSGLQLDLFTARPKTFGLILLIRTGPADYSRRFVTDAKTRGHHVADGELHAGRLGCSATPCTVIPTPDERLVYTALGLRYKPPEKRL